MQTAREGEKMSKPKKADDYDVIEHEPRTLKFRGDDVTILPLTVGQLPKVARALRGVAITSSAPAALFELVAEHGDQVLEAVSLATGIAREQVEAANLPAFVELLSVVIEVNAAFFTEAVGAMLGTIAGLNGAGPTSSTGSSTQDIASTT